MKRRIEEEEEGKGNDLQANNASYKQRPCQCTETVRTTLLVFTHRKSSLFLFPMRAQATPASTLLCSQWRGHGGMGAISPQFCQDDAWDFTEVDEKIVGVRGDGKSSEKHRAWHKSIFIYSPLFLVLPTPLFAPVKFSMDPPLPLAPKISKKLYLTFRQGAIGLPWRHLY